MSENNMDDMERPLMDVLKEAGLLEQALNDTKDKADSLNTSLSSGISTARIDEYIKKLKQVADAFDAIKNASKLEKIKQREIAKLEQLHSQPTLEEDYKIRNTVPYPNILKTQEEFDAIEKLRQKKVDEFIAARKASGFRIPEIQAQQDAIRALKLDGSLAAQGKGIGIDNDKLRNIEYSKRLLDGDISGSGRRLIDKLTEVSDIIKNLKFNGTLAKTGEAEANSILKDIDTVIAKINEYKKIAEKLKPSEELVKYNHSTLPIIESPYESALLEIKNKTLRLNNFGATLNNEPLKRTDLPYTFMESSKSFTRNTVTPLLEKLESIKHIFDGFDAGEYTSELRKRLNNIFSAQFVLNSSDKPKTAGGVDYFSRLKGYMAYRSQEYANSHPDVELYTDSNGVGSAKRLIDFISKSGIVQDTIKDFKREFENTNIKLGGVAVDNLDFGKIFQDSVLLGNAFNFEKTSNGISSSLLNNFAEQYKGVLGDINSYSTNWALVGSKKAEDVLSAHKNKIAEQIAENKKVEEATTSAANETTQALAAEASKRVEDIKKVEEATVAETKKANTDIVADTKNTADQNAATYRAMQKQQASDATVLARSLNRIQNEESKTRIENLKQQNSLARIDAKSTADKSLETQRQNGKLEVENAKAVAKEKEIAAKEAARVKTAADKAATDAIKHQNQLELENVKQQHRLELEHEKAALRDARDERKRAEREKANAAKQSAREELEETRRVEREKRELERESEKAKRDIKRALAQEQKEQEKREKQTAKEKEKAEKDAAKAAAQAEKDATKKAEEAAKTKKEAWQIVGNAIKKVADIVKNSLSKALSLVKKDIQLTVSLVKKGVDLFKSAGNTILRVLNLFGNFGDRLRSLFSGGIINGILKGFNGLLNTVADVPNKILDNRFVQVGESLLASIQSLNIIIGKDLTNNTIAWANELERGFGLSADGLIADMRGVAGVLKGLGMDGGDTATASKNLSIMSRSFSVMLGYKPEEAMSKIESGMKGMTASVDDLGISVREAEMNSFLKELKARGGEFAGIATSFSNLNEEQRVYVRYAAMIDQYLKAFSIEKYAKSLDTITGRLSILRERTRAFMSAVGNLFLQLFNKLVVPLTYAIDVITQKIKALTSFLGLGSELSANMNGMTDDVSTTIDTSGSVNELGKEAKALDDVSKAAKEAKGGMDSFDHITSMHSSSSSGSSKSGDGADGSDFDYSKLMDLNADDLAKRMEEMSKTMEDHTNSYKNKVKDGLAKIRKAIDTWYKGQTGSKIDWNKIFNLADFKKATEGMGKSIARSGKAIKDTFGVLLIKFAQDININRVLSKSLGLINEALGALADILAFLKPILIELYDEIISPIVKELGDKIATSLDGIREKLKQFREDLASGKYSNIKIVIRTLLTGETSESDLNYLKGNDIMKGTNLSGLNTAAEKLHGFFASILELIKQIGGVIVGLFKEMFNGEHRTIIDVIIDAIHRISNFIKENKDAIIEILAALIDLQVAVIEAVINAILGIAKWLVEHKDTVVSILNKIKDIVDWLGKHIGVVIGFYLTIKTLSILSSAVIWVSTFVKAIGTIKTALAGASAASTAASAAGGAAGGAASAAGGAAKAGLGTKLLLNPFAVATANFAIGTAGASYDWNKENTKWTNDYLKEHGELGQATIDLAKANGSGYIIGDDGLPITIKDTSGFFGIFKSMKAQLTGGYGLQAEDIDNTLDKVVPKYLKIFKESGYTSASEVAQYYDKIVEGFIKENQHLVDKGDISQEQLDAAAKYFRLALEKNIDEAFKSDNKIENAINDIADSMDNAANKFTTLDDVLNGNVFDPNNTQNKTSVSLDDLIRDSVEVEPIHISGIIDDSIQRATNIASDVNKKVAEAVSIIKKDSEDTHSKISTELINSMQTMNSGTEEVKNSFSTVELGLSKASGAVGSFIKAAINSVDGLRTNVRTLSSDVQLLNNDTSSALSVIRSVISSASSALSGVMSGVMSTIGGAVGIPSVRNIFGFANGGAPKSGQMFIAREDGMPELVGNFGGYSGVANNDMIVRAMHDAIYDGMMAAGAGSNTYGGNGGTVNFNNYGYFGGDRASFRQFAEMINNANKSSDSNIANRSFRS